MDMNDSSSPWLGVKWYYSLWSLESINSQASHLDIFVMFSFFLSFLANGEEEGVKAGQKELKRALMSSRKSTN